MSLRVILAAALLLAVAAGRAAAEEPMAARKTAEDSLLFSSELLALIEAARRPDRDLSAAAAAPADGAAPPAAPEAIHLGAIVYLAADDWRIWLNGRSFTPGTAPGALEILAVTAGTVRLAWRGDPARPPERFELRPNQSYLVASGAVVEGPVRSRRTGQAERGARP